MEWTLDCLQEVGGEEVEMVYKAYSSCPLRREGQYVFWVLYDAFTSGALLTLEGLLIPKDTQQLTCGYTLQMQTDPSRAPSHDQVSHWASVPCTNHPRAKIQTNRDSSYAQSPQTSQS